MWKMYFHWTLQDLFLLICFSSDSFYRSDWAKRSKEGKEESLCTISVQTLNSEVQHRHLRGAKSHFSYSGRRFGVAGCHCCAWFITKEGSVTSGVTGTWADLRWALKRSSLGVHSPFGMGECCPHRHPGALRALILTVVWYEKCCSQNTAFTQFKATWGQEPRFWGRVCNLFRVI